MLANEIHELKKRAGQLQPIQPRNINIKYRSFGESNSCDINQHYNDNYSTHYKQKFTYTL
jgi:hypothetical protein